MAIQWTFSGGFRGPRAPIIINESSAGGIQWVTPGGIIVNEQAAAVGGGFQSAWAKGVNTILGAGAVR